MAAACNSPSMPPASVFRQFKKAKVADVAAPGPDSTSYEVRQLDVSPRTELDLESDISSVWSEAEGDSGGSAGEEVLLSLEGDEDNGDDDQGPVANTDVVVVQTGEKLFEDDDDQEHQDALLAQ
jgi:hypothetical protein